ncbi:FAD/NAD(P)-binding domain-containing protein [Sparassis latifolia]|uniref:Thiol-specific monooxygenase n=1 Tax=Sparassis crispa TaxID=139825 RepID=A0A401GSK2_9APHY|nr:Thiol-specific monooxygenase [Sparassis crispa]GBE85212.1 Thiol-specific monooxygenase [Sparassis crispa]
MVNVAQFILSFLPLALWNEPHIPAHEHPEHTPAKSIAIVGAGSGGLAALRTILNLPEDTRAGWEIVLYEQHRNVGGLWLPDPPGYDARPPELPESPVYPLLHTNTPHPTMTYPNFTFRPLTPLFPSWDYVEQYHVDFAEHFNLTPYIKLNHTVADVQWRGNAIKGKWDIEVHTRGEAGELDVVKRKFDHLIVANGHNHYPYIPTWNGTEGWLANTPPGTPKREILHSIYYRDPEKYTNRSVIIVGAGASARDAAQQVSPLAREAYQSISPSSVPAPGASVVVKPRILHFTDDSIVFVDGTVLTSVDSLILGTGYEFLVPFLSASPSSPLNVDPQTAVNSTTAHKLTTNLRYIFPLHRHIFSLSSSYPSTALAFVGLPVLIANCPSDIAQSLLIAHALANSSLLPTREAMLDELVQHEDSLRVRGLDPYYVGHRLVGGDTEAQDYQDNLIEYLKKVGVLPDDGKKYVEPWRRLGRTESDLIRRGWQRVQELGEDAKWLDGALTEEDWAGVLVRLVEWQREWENEHGIIWM